MATRLGLATVGSRRADKTAGGNEPAPTCANCSRLCRRRQDSAQMFDARKP